MAREQTQELQVGHPESERGRVSKSTLLIDFSLGAFAWVLQFTVLAAFYGQACPAGDGPATGVAPGGWQVTASLVVNAVAILVALAALAMSMRNLARSGKTSGHHELLDVGEGRSHFLSIWGVFANLLFLIAIGVNSITVFGSGMCNGS
jgi:hypothetical protein